MYLLFTVFPVHASTYRRGVPVVGKDWLSVVVGIGSCPLSMWLAGRLEAQLRKSVFEVFVLDVYLVKGV